MDVDFLLDKNEREHQMTIEEALPINQAIIDDVAKHVLGRKPTPDEAERIINGARAVTVCYMEACDMIGEKPTKAGLRQNILFNLNNNVDLIIDTRLN